MKDNLVDGCELSVAIEYEATSDLRKARSELATDDLRQAMGNE